jgi:hypothetical protein
MTMMMRALALLLVLLSSSSADAAMARVWITEFLTIRVEAAAPMATLPSLVAQPVLDISTTRQASAPFNAQTRYVRIVCEVNCVIKNGGTVSQNDLMLPALRPEYFGVQPGSSISVTAVPP